MNIKVGARRDNLHPKLETIIAVAEALWPAWFPDDADGALITSGNEGHPGDGVHGFSSKHYPENNASKKGEAIDLRLNDVKNGLAHNYAAALEYTLLRVHGIQTTFLLEKLLTPSAHLHIQLR